MMEYGQSTSKEKNEARSQKEKDKADPKLKHIYTMDLQAVMVCPRMKASALYYRTKLLVHNFTIFNLKTKEGNCYCD